MGKRRIIGVVALGALVFGGAFIAFNWTNIQRLKTVATMFDEDKIVHNFSNMNEAFLHQQLDASPKPFIFPEAFEGLPETVMVNGQSRDLTKLLADLDTTGLVILKDGKVIHESYHKGTAQNDLRISWSMAKSFMSGLYGAALNSGAVKSLDDKVEDYAPSLKGSAYEGATIRNVLNMASGITYNEDYMDPKSDINDMGRILGLGGSMDDYAAGLTAKDVPAGERWQYVSIDTHIAAMVLRKATGKSLHQLFNETYSANLGFEEAPIYMTDGENVAFALGGLNLTTRDYAKFGQMFLQGGEFGGTQVIPADWVKASTFHSAPTKGDRGVGYGYQWWIPMPQSGPNKGDYTAAGIYGQYIYVNPARGIVIAKNAADREFAYPQEGYGHSMNVNMDMFRSLADYYGQDENAYFKANHFAAESAHKQYAELLKTWEEPSFKVLDDDTVASYRFFYRPSFSDSVLVRVTETATSKKLFRRKFSRIDRKYIDESFELTEAQFLKLQQGYDAIDVCQDIKKLEWGLDGSTWMFETRDKLEHCALEKWQPAKDSPYNNLGQYLMTVQPTK